MNFYNKIKIKVSNEVFFGTLVILAIALGIIFGEISRQYNASATVEIVKVNK